jgi:hypothetical protein
LFLFDGKADEYTAVSYGDALRAVVLGENFPIEPVDDCIEACSEAGVAIRRNAVDPVGPPRGPTLNFQLVELIASREDAQRGLAKCSTASSPKGMTALLLSTSTRRQNGGGRATAWDKREEHGDRVAGRPLPSAVAAVDAWDLPRAGPSG